MRKKVLVMMSLCMTLFVSKASALTLPIWHRVS